jgi:hypothetical protein
VEVVRDRNNNVQSIQVLKGHAGTTIEFIKEEEDEEGSLNGEPGEGTWTYQNDRARGYRYSLLFPWRA